MAKLKKCINCKWAGINNKKKAYAYDHCTHPKASLPDEREMKYTTNSKHFTHCDKHEFHNG